MSEFWIGMATGNIGRRRRRAMTILEVVITAALLMVLMTMSTQMMRALGAQQRSTERRGLAMRTVQALAEQVGNTPWKELTQQSAESIKIPEAVVTHLPNAQLKIAVEQESEPVPAKRATIELRWNGGGGQPVAPTRLTTWVFPEDSENEN